MSPKASESTGTDTATTVKTNTAEIVKTCPICWDTFTAGGSNARRHTYCTPRCRKSAYERRQRGQHIPEPPTPTTTTPATTSTAPTIEQLPQPAAHRTCPHCGQPVTIVALLTTPQAARPQSPTAPTGVIQLRRQHR